MPIADIIDLEAFRSPPVRVERLPDANRPNRTGYRISGHRCADVQDYVNSLLAEVEMHGAGFGRFIGPHRVDDRYVALGEIVVFSEVP